MSYSHDAAGRFNGASGTGYGNVTQFASNLQYRAWGGLKHLSYGNNLNLDQQYNSRLQITRYALSPVNYSGTWQVNRAQDYQYYNDGRIKFMQDEANNLFDRGYSFDQVGRIAKALTGHEARGEEFGPLSAYSETFNYDAWNNTTGRNTRWWNHQYNAGLFTYQNNRRSGYLYDSDGRVTADHGNPNLAATINYTYDVRGMKTSARQGDNSNIAVHEFDGDGRLAKIVTTTVEESVTTTYTGYEVNSTALGGVVIEDVNAQGVRTQQHVYTSDGTELAAGNPEATMIFKHIDPVTSTEQGSWTNAADSYRTELDPVGGDVGTYQPVEDDPGQDFPLNHGSLSQPFDHCSAAGLPDTCSGSAYAIWGPHIADLPGFGTNWGSMVQLGEREHGRQVAENLFWTILSRREGNLHPTDLLMVRTVVENSEPSGEQFQHARRRRSKKKAKPINSRSACDKFAEDLASRLYTSVVSLGGYNPDARHDLGNDMNAQAVEDVDSTGTRYTKRVYPIDGFKPQLTANGQDADVYRHILFTAGNGLHGTVAADATNASFRFWDWQQSVRGRRESDSELLDDDAGMAVGAQMLNTALAGKNGDYWGLKAQIKSILCDY